MKTRSELGGELISGWDEFEQLVFVAADVATDGVVKVNSAADLHKAMAAVQQAGVLSLQLDDWLEPLSVRTRYLLRRKPTDDELRLAVEALTSSIDRLREWLGERAPAREPWEPV